MEIALPIHEAPSVSIIIPVYNQVQLTLACLESIAKAQSDIGYEVIVVDDASTDATYEQLSHIKGVRVVRNVRNEGFVGSCNHGASVSRCKFLHFLNNDTLVSDHWLDHMIRTVREGDHVGLVGCKLLSDDHRLQEAGGIIWRDGSAWNFGRGRDAGRPEFNYVRDVDYCSGAAILISRHLFFEVGMFNDAYRPGYYEDVDLAFCVRSHGYRVVYQPAAVVYHLDGGTTGRDLTSGMKQYLSRNQEIFFARWRNELIRHRPNAERPELEKERHVTQRLLIIDHRIPEPDKDAGSVRMWNLIRIAQRMGHKITFAPDNLQILEPYSGRLRDAGVEVLGTPHVVNLREYLRENGALFDNVLISRAPIAHKHIDAVRKFCPQAHVLFDTVDLHYLREMRQAELNPAASSTWRKTKSEELAAAHKADVTLVVSEAEQTLLAAIPGLRIEIVSTVHDPVGSNLSFEGRRGLLFIGGFEHSPNVDACLWLAKEIMPHVWACDPTLTLYILGSKVTAEVAALAGERVEVLGYVPDAAPYFEVVRCSVAPLRFGAGVKGKIGHSMAMGVPCVATTLGAEGMGLIDGHDVLLGDDPRALADAILRIHSDPELWSKISKNSLASVASRFSTTVAEAALARALRRRQVHQIQSADGPRAVA